jgi:hypothetical protein
MGRILNRALPVLRLRHTAKQAGFAMALCFTLTICYAETIQKKFSTTANPSFLLRNYVGTVSVTGWDQNEIDIQGQAASDAIEVILMGGEQKVSVQAHPRREGLSPQEARLNLQIHVPHNAAVRVDSERGEIIIENLDGGLTIGGIGTAVAITKVSGNITVNTVDGPIRIQSSQGHIKAESISGDLTFVQVNGSELRASTNSGRIRYEGDFGQAGTYVLNSYSSPIDILPSANANFDLTARAVQGMIESNLPFRPTPLGNPFRRLSPGKFLQGRFNNGDSTVEVTSFSGTIRVQGVPKGSGPQ